MKTLAQFSGMPQMRAAFSGWLSPIVISIITQKVVDGFSVNIENKISFKGVIQPLSPLLIELKPEGQRTREWIQIHCPIGELNVKPNDKIIWNDKRFKIMADNNFNLDGFNEYHAIRDYEDAKAC